MLICAFYLNSLLPVLGFSCWFYSLVRLVIASDSATPANFLPKLSHSWSPEQQKNIVHVPNGEDEKTWTMSPWKLSFRFALGAKGEAGLSVHLPHGKFYIRNTLISVVVVSTSGCPAGHYRKDEIISKEPFKRDSSVWENKTTATVVSENHPDAGLVSEAKRGGVGQPWRRCSKRQEVLFS